MVLRKHGVARSAWRCARYSCATSMGSRLHSAWLRTMVLRARHGCCARHSVALGMAALGACDCGRARRMAALGAWGIAVCAWRGCDRAWHGCVAPGTALLRLALLLCAALGGMVSVARARGMTARSAMVCVVALRKWLHTRRGDVRRGMVVLRARRYVAAAALDDDEA